MKPIIILLALALLTVNCYALPYRSIEFSGKAIDDFLVNWLNTTVKNSLLNGINESIEIKSERTPVEVKKQNIEPEQYTVRAPIATRSGDSRNNMYRIKKGDTLWSIAKRYNTSVQEIEKLNPSLNAKNLAIGSYIIMPFNINKELNFEWPVIGQITSPFGMRNNDFHRGLDIGAKTSTKIAASATGVVIEAGWDTYYGRYVLIDHGNDYKTRYAHASKLLVSKGKWVNSGEIIALVGSTGKSTGPHLHFEIIKDNVPQNPMKYLP